MSRNRHLKPPFSVQSPRKPSRPARIQLSGIGIRFNPRRIKLKNSRFHILVCYISSIPDSAFTANKNWTYSKVNIEATCVGGVPCERANTERWGGDLWWMNIQVGWLVLGKNWLWSRFCVWFPVFYLYFLKK